MWVVRFSDKQLEVVRAVLRSEEHRGPALEGALEALDLARWDDLPEAQLPWTEVEAEAIKQGVSEADVIWDRSGRHDEPAVPPIAAKSRVKRKGKQAALEPRGHSFAAALLGSAWSAVAGCGGARLRAHLRTASTAPRRCRSSTGRSRSASGPPARPSFAP